MAGNLWRRRKVYVAMEGDYFVGIARNLNRQLEVFAVVSKDWLILFRQLCSYEASVVSVAEDVQTRVIEALQLVLFAVGYT